MGRLGEGRKEQRKYSLFFLGCFLFQKLIRKGYSMDLGFKLCVRNVNQDRISKIFLEE